MLCISIKVQTAIHLHHHQQEENEEQEQQATKLRSTTAKAVCVHIQKVFSSTIVL